MLEQKSTDQKMKKNQRGAIELKRSTRNDPGSHQLGTKRKLNQGPTRSRKKNINPDLGTPGLSRGRRKKKLKEGTKVKRKGGTKDLVSIHKEKRRDSGGPLE